MRFPVRSLLLALCAPAFAAPAAAARPIAWDKAEAVSAANIRVVTVQARRATRFVVRPGDSPVRSGERTELVASVDATGAREGELHTYRWSTRFPSDFAPVPDSTWNIFTQWHGSEPNGCHPNIALQVNTARRPAMLRLQVRGGNLGPDCAPEQSRSWDFAPLTLNRWEDLALTVGWSQQVGGGFVALRMNGIDVVPRTPLATLYTGEAAYLKQGFYRAPSAATSTIFHTAISETAP